MTVGFPLGWITEEDGNGKMIGNKKSFVIYFSTINIIKNLALKLMICISIVIINLRPSFVVFKRIIHPVF
ncbi:hypothetical protein RhiirA5_69799 [Rhizophagus irregularis]|uniref:Uncharacterized protein n=1 Tax=Rhizophagus irregularis TaxID=588596 RepID=A0A2N0Q2X3_9GLOM|nr:hypothetical protein RhiirA5_69799 [Rhizophagus irregularis]